MHNLIDVLGGNSRVTEILHYHQSYFKNYGYYDIARKMFVKRVDDNRVMEFIPVDKIKLELRK